jgi:hypothetical protein
MANGPVAAHLTVKTNGDVIPITTTTGWVALWSVRFPKWEDTVLRHRPLDQCPNHVDYTPAVTKRPPRLVLRRNGFVEITGVAGNGWADSSVLADLAPCAADLTGIHTGGTGWVRLDSRRGRLIPMATVAGYGVLGGTTQWPLPAIEHLFNPLTLLNSWKWYGEHVSNNADNYSMPGYYKDNDGVVHLRGLIGGGTSATASIATLPVGFRPAHRMMWPTLSSVGWSRLDIETTGNITAPENGGVAFQSLGTVSFPTT